MKQTYKEFLEESTNTVKSNTRKAKILLVLATLGIWVLSLLAMGVVYSGVDSFGLSLMVIWLVLPVTFLTVSAIAGSCSCFGRFWWLFALGISLLYTLSSYATAILSAAANSAVFWPGFTKLPIGLALSLAGFGLGFLLRKRSQRKA